MKPHNNITHQTECSADTIVHLKPTSQRVLKMYMYTHHARDYPWKYKIQDSQYCLHNITDIYCISKSKHLLIQYGLRGANDLRLARLESGAQRTQQNLGVIVRIPFIKYLPSEQSQQQRYILWINTLSAGCNELWTLLSTHLYQVNNSSTPVENLLIYFLVFSLPNCYFLTQCEISCTQVI
jgi:hypothetical protein